MEVIKIAMILINNVGEGGYWVYMDHPSWDSYSTEGRLIRLLNISSCEEKHIKHGMYHTLVVWIPYSQA